MKQTLLLLIGFFAVAMVSPLAGQQASQDEKKAPEVKKAESKTPAEADEKKPAPNPVVKMVTTKGEILIELDAGKAPITVENFLKYTQDGFYDGTVFHRVIKGFMIQGGGMTPNMQKKQTRPPIKNESYNQLRNKRGTIAMARTNAPDSATSQFFINHVDNDNLDFDGPMKPGYAVFGKVIQGMDVVDAIAVVPTRPGDVPVETVVIESVTLIETVEEDPHKGHDEHKDHDEDGHDHDKSEHDND